MRHFTPGGSIFGDYWAGFRYIQKLISDPTCWSVFRTRASWGLLTLIFSFPYLPHFMSVVIVVGMIFQLSSLQATINRLLGHLDVAAIDFMQQASWFRPVYVGSPVWQNMGGRDPLPGGADHHRREPVRGRPD